MDYQSARVLIGKQVKVTLNYEDNKIIVGELVQVHDDGEFVIRTTDNQLRYGWPYLDIEELGDEG
jgi:hypothetical protein